MPPVRCTCRLVNLCPGPANTQALDDALAMRQCQREANAQSGSQQRVYTPEQLAVLGVEIMLCQWQGLVQPRTEIKQGLT